MTPSAWELRKHNWRGACDTSPQPSVPIFAKSGDFAHGREIGVDVPNNITKKTEVMPNQNINGYCVSLGQPRLRSFTVWTRYCITQSASSGIGSNCGMQFRCVKCRRKRILLRTLQLLSPIRSANCGNEGHVSSSYDYPKSKAILNKKEKRKEEVANKATAKSERLSRLRNGVSCAAPWELLTPPVGDARPAGVASPAGPGRSVAPTGGSAEYGNAIFEEGSRSSSPVGLMLYIGGIPV